MEARHISVLLPECIEALNIRPDGIYVDGTLGMGGHSAAIAERLTTGLLIGIDRDETAIQRAGERLKPFGERVKLVHGNFRNTAAILDQLGIAGVDGMLFDLGVSSPQLDEADRGFSYMHDAPLDMRMDASDELNAWFIVNCWPEEKLKRILYDYGEERHAPRIASAILRARAEKPIETTLQLVDVILILNPEPAFRFAGDRAHQTHHFLGQQPKMQGVFAGQILIGCYLIHLIQSFFNLASLAGNHNHICFHEPSPVLKR